MIKLEMTIDEDTPKDDIIRALNANNAYACLSEIDDIFRCADKWGVFDGKNLAEDQIELMGKIREKIRMITCDLPEQF